MSNKPDRTSAMPNFGEKARPGKLCKNVRRGLKRNGQVS